MTFLSSGEFIDKLNKLFNGFIAMPLLLVAYGYLEIYSGSYTGVIINESLYITGFLILVIVVSMLLISRNFKSKVSTINSSNSISSKIEAYFEIARRYYLVVFALSVFTTILLFVFGEKSYAGAYAFILFVLSVYRPGLRTIATQLGIKGQDKKDFVDKVLFTDYTGDSGQ